ncbi:Hsp20/alpha crystallin family protein [Sulfurihydrogenibium sp.]|uniref:Hsp20/alpha crystallin family protein n=1 Tax=Sulfurihydrogenibium sp. TaxID=2053621 RepID=UPI002621949D|nr:Hsp20/alpha crystallin family protein [Sulfurihydrogenibium sp.]
MINLEKPPIDVLENEDAYIVVIDIPGVEKSDIEITGDENSITVKAFRNQPFKGRYHIVERFNGWIKRKIKFPQTINLNQAKAHYENGVLTVYLPKTKNQFIIDTCFKIYIP